MTLNERVDLWAGADEHVPELQTAEEEKQDLGLQFSSSLAADSLLLLLEAC